MFLMWTVDAIATAVRSDAMKGVWAQAFWYHDLTGFQDEAVVKAANDFAAKYMEENNEPPDPYAVTSYCAIKETARAIELAKSTDPVKMYEALMANPEWNSAKGGAKWREDGRCIYQYFDWVIEGKGPNDRKEGRFGSKYDYASIVSSLSGDAFMPTLKELGY